MKKSYFRLIGINNSININNLPLNISNNNWKIDKFIKNYSSSTKYSLLNFLPLVTFLIFSKVSNLFYLLISIIVLIPNVSPFSPISTISGVIFIYLFTLTGELIENLQRWLNDKKENEKKCIIINNNNTYNIKKWYQIKVGDIILLKENDIIPADIIQLSSSFDNGKSFIETSNLDGEKNLKKKNSVKETFLLSNMRPIINNKFMVYAEPPNNNLFNFNGRMYFIENDKINDNYSILDIDNFLFKGCKLKNVDWVLGVVVYTGKDTKIMNNLNKPIVKVSFLEKKTNLYIIILILINFILVLTIFIIKFINGRSDFEKNILKLSYNESTVETALSYFITLSYIVSINYSVSVEFAKIFIGLLFNSSLELKSQFNKINCKVRSNQIIDNLSKVDFILSDKTGTITVNSLEFQGCFIGNNIYGGKILENQEKNYEFILNNIPELGLINFTFYDEDINLMLLKLKYIPLQKPLIIYDENKLELYSFHSQNDLCFEFFKNLSLAHECNVKIENERIKYESSSPDDVTLCNSAYNNGIIYEGIENENIKLFINEKDIILKKLCQFNFDSHRKSMSIAIEENNLVKLYIKGADSKIYSNLNMANNSLSFVNKCKEHSHIFSTMGKRVIVSAIRVMKLEEWEKIYKEYKSILVNYTESELEEKKRNFIEEFIETNLTLLGFSVLNDKLQDNVRYTIKKFINADIKFWMITGDNLETAKFISRSAGIISRKTKIFFIVKKEDFWNSKNEILELVENNKKCSVIIDMNRLNNLGVLKKYMKLLVLIDSVVCARCSPKNKGILVKYVQDEGKNVLGIGDGANDINLIQDSNIGIGIFGQEGSQASNVSDISIGEFQKLWILIFVFGRWTYIRITLLIVYTFYKNYLMCFYNVIYGVFNDFSGKSLFSGWYVIAYNLFITAGPIMFLVFIEKDIDYRELIKFKNEPNKNISFKQSFLRKLNPFLLLMKNFKINVNKFIKNNFERLYFEFKNNKFFNFNIFFGRLILSFIYCIITLFITKYSFININYYGWEFGIYEFGYVVYFSMIIYFNILLLIICNQITLIFVLNIFFGSVVVFIIFGFSVSAIFDEEYWLFQKIFISLPIYLILLLLITIGFMIEFAIKLLTYIYNPNSGHYWNLLNKKFKNNKNISFFWNDRFLENKELENKDNFEEKGK